MEYGAAGSVPASPTPVRASLSRWGLPLVQRATFIFFAQQTSRPPALVERESKTVIEPRAACACPVDLSRPHDSSLSILVLIAPHQTAALAFECSRAAVSSTGGRMTGRIRGSGQHEPVKRVSRRAFGKLIAGATVALSAGSLPLLIPARLMGAEAPSNRLRVAQIGCGRIAQVHDVPAVLGSGLADYVAVCDLDSRRVADSKAQVEAFYRQSSAPKPQVRSFSDYRELLTQP